MKKMMLTFAFAPLLALAAAAQDVSWSDLAVGDRIEVTFQSGNTISGSLVATNPKTSSIDYSKESSLVLDVTWEYPGLNGTMTVAKKEVKSLRKLRVMDEKMKQRLLEMKQKLAADNAKAAEPKADPAPVEPKVEPKPEAPKTEDEKLKAELQAKKDAEERKKAMDFYAKFPSPYWGPERHIVNVQKKARGQALSAAEIEFEAGYLELWDKGRAASAPKKD
jgi:hypothetical protein